MASWLSNIIKTDKKLYISLVNRAAMNSLYAFILFGLLQTGFVAGTVNLLMYPFSWQAQLYNGSPIHFVQKHGKVGFIACTVILLHKYITAWTKG